MFKKKPVISEDNYANIQSLGNQGMDKISHILYCVIHFVHSFHSNKTR